MTNVSVDIEGRRRPPPLPRPPRRAPFRASLEKPPGGLVSAIAIAVLLAMLLLHPFTRVSSLDALDRQLDRVVRLSR